MTYSDNDWKDVNPHIPPGYDNTKFNVVFDHHSHTNYRDGALTIKQNVEWHIAMGFNASHARYILCQLPPLSDRHRQH